MVPFNLLVTRCHCRLRLWIGVVLPSIFFSLHSILGYRILNSCAESGGLRYRQGVCSKSPVLINLELSSIRRCLTHYLLLFLRVQQYKWSSCIQRSIGALKFHGLINLELLNNLEVSGLLFTLFFACTTVQIVVMDLEEYWRYRSTGFQDSFMFSPSFQLPQLPF